MTKQKALAERQRLQDELATARTAQDNAAHESRTAEAAVKQLGREHRKALTAAARGGEDTSKADELKAEIASQESVARAAKDRVDAAHRAGREVQRELRAHVVNQMHHFAAEADSLADVADADRAKALAATQKAEASDAAARAAWSRISRAAADQPAANIRLGSLPPESRLSEAVAIVQATQRPEPAQADEARRPGILDRAFRRYRHTSSGDSKRVPVDSAQDRLLREDVASEWEPVEVGNV